MYILYNKDKERERASGLHPLTPWFHWNFYTFNTILYNRAARTFCKWIVKPKIDTRVLSMA
jgi:hypothetical protein